MRENRSEPRINMMVRVAVVWTDKAGTEHTAEGKLEDLSDGGMSIRVNAPILVGSKLVAQTPHGHFPGTVVRSSKEGQALVLGVKRDVAEQPESS
jgi:PilZ domain